MDVVERLGELLREAGFGRERHGALMGVPGGVPPAEVLAALDRPEDARLAILVELFHEGRPQALERVERAIDPLSVGELMDAGVLEAGDSGVRSRVRLTSFDGWLVVGDSERDPPEKEDFVVGVTLAGKAVAYTTVRRPIEAALDLGTGSGLQALFAARHARRVIAADVNPRALHLASLNERLNGVENITRVQGDWFEPVKGRRFELVVVNPPVVISPDNSLLYRDSATGGEELSRRLVRESAEHLTEGGFATVFCSWTHGRSAWEDEPRQWVAGLDCDALVLNFGSHDPLGYAMVNVVDHPNLDPTAITDTVNRWIGHYRRAGVEQIAFGAVILRRRTTGVNWARAFPLPGGPHGPAGDQLERMFAGGDFLAAHSGAKQLSQLLSSSWRLVDGHRLHQTLVHENGTYGSGHATLRQEPGMNLDAQVDLRIVPVIVGCDGGRPLAKVLGETPVPEGLEQSEFHRLCLETVRDLIARGFLVGPAY